ncbi:MAG: AIPR family protein [bacterium]
MYLSDDIKKELDYFRRLHEHYSVQVGEKQIFLKDADKKILYILMSASYAMDIFEDDFFENFILTDKQLTNKQELQIDAYAFIETDTSSEKHLHLFQYKLYDNNNHGVSPVEVKNFASIMNDLFVHPELRTDSELNNPVFKEIDDLISNFLKGRSNKKIKVKCHFITNAYGIHKTNKKIFTDLFGKFEYDKQHHGFGLQVYGEKEILELTMDGKIRIDKEIIEVLLDAQQNSYRLEDNSKKGGLGLPDKVLIGICNVHELIRLQNKYHHNQLYSENIRLYLGDRAAVNKDIIQTIISSESQWFPYMNNGISMICDRINIGMINPKKDTLPIELTNLQIINGCQTVNALYSARYGEDTWKNFKSSNILIRIYQIDPSQQRFKQSIIKATNNQNAIKTYSLFANDPIQIEIQNVLKKFDYLYDRKGESKQEAAKKRVNIVSMVQSALAYRAVFEFGGQKLRARIGQSRVFQKEEYERIYKNEYLENADELNKLSVKLLTSSLILNTVRDLINKQSGQYLQRLPVIKKSAYYLSGLYYAHNKKECEKFINECLELLREDNPAKIKSSSLFAEFIEQIRTNFSESVNEYQKFYDGLGLDKTDIDNLLKSSDFGKQYENLVKYFNL